MNKQTDEIQSLLKIKCWREAQARRMLEIWKQSEGSLMGFCRQHGVGYKRLIRWQRLLKAQPVTLDFIEVDPVRTYGLSDQMEIVLINGRSIRIHPGFNPQALHRAIDVVEDITCG